jgi:hypothetical protein
MFTNRLSKLSSSKTVFDTAKQEYTRALNQAGYSEEIEYVSQPTINKMRNRGRKTIWFNPPYSVAVRGNLTKMFSNIIRTTLPHGHVFLSRLFNKHNLRLSYSTTPNLQSIISQHNSKLIKEYRSRSKPPQKLCNCRVKNDCPMDGKCLSESVVYRADVTATGTVQESKFYNGATGNTFKERYNNHKASLSHVKNKESTRLSMYVWELKEKGAHYNIKWSIIKKVPAYKPGDRECRLCLAEKMTILECSLDKRCLNKRSELFSKCPHRRKSLLSTVK